MKTEGKRNADNSQKRSVHAVFGVFLSLDGLLFILSEREKFYYFLLMIKNYAGKWQKHPGEFLRK